VVVVATQGTIITPSWFQDMLGRFGFTEYRLLPSWWLSTGLLQAALPGNAHLSDAVMFLALTISNALFFRQGAIWIAAVAYRRAYNGLHGLHKPRPRARIAWIDRLAGALAAPFSPQLRLILVKDFRLFRRDPIQWLQIVILIGLMAVYYLYLPTLTNNPAHSQWLSVVSFLNLSVVGLLLSTFTTRFIFPMISLEGRRFWVIGLLPVRRETILWSKFVFAVGTSLVPSSLLVLTSDLALRVPPMLVASHQFVCAILCFGLAGIAVGLGARMPNSREESPARIAAGFGGTLNLVLGTLYILVVVLMTTLPWHFYLTPQNVNLAPDSWVGRWIVRWIDVWVWGGTLGSLLLGVVATFVPLIVGLRAFRKAEF
jgi:ABC-2 type transport system permease protein